MKKIASALIALVLLAGCGEPFHLRGSNSTTVKLAQGIYLQGDDKSGAFSQALRDGLNSAGASVKASAADAPVTLTITQYRENRTVSGYSATRQVREFNHTLEVSFRVSGQGVSGDEERSVHVERYQVYNGTYVLGTSEEEDTIKQEMRREAVRLLLLRLRAAIPQTAN